MQLVCAVEQLCNAAKPDSPTPERVYKTHTVRLYWYCLPGKLLACGLHKAVPGFEKATRVTTLDVLMWPGVNMSHFRSDLGWDEHGADDRYQGFMNLRKRDSGEIKRRCQFSYLELLCKIIYYLLYLELR